MEKIVLVGYMGSGKSLIATLLEGILGWERFELDDLIEKSENISISEIFETKGELYFRKLEKKIFDELMLLNRNIIISTGGGTPCYFENYKSLQNEKIISIYLKASIETLISRIENEIQKRPMLNNLNKSELEEFIAKHLFERSYYYLKCKFKINVDFKSPKEIADEVISILA
ncbi:MAG: shikimate kinase [Flavobacterium sp.]|jgi:shikimate kinase